MRRTITHVHNVPPFIDSLCKNEEEPDAIDHDITSLPCSSFEVDAECCTVWPKKNLPTKVGQDYCVEFRPIRLWSNDE